MPFNQFCGLGEETAFGTAVARSAFAKTHQGSTINHKADRSKSSILSANVGADPERQFEKSQYGEGKLVVPLSYDSKVVMLLLKHGLGLYAVTGAGPYTHTFTRKVGPPFAAGSVATATGLSAELNYELPDTSLEARLLTSALVKSLTLDLNAGEEFKLDCDLIGQKVTQVVKSAAPTYPDYDNYLAKFSQVAISIDAGGDQAAVVAGLSLSIDNGYQTDVRLGSVYTRSPKRQGTSDIKGSLKMNWETGYTPTAKAIWDKFVAGTSASIVATLTGPTNYSMIVTLSNCRYTGGDLAPEEGQLQSVEFPFDVYHDGTNTAVKVVLSNQTTTI